MTHSKAYPAIGPPMGKFTENQVVASVVASFVSPANRTGAPHRVKPCGFHEANALPMRCTAVAGTPT